MIKAVKLEGTSMRPLFREGETVLLETSRAAIRPGDCVAYEYRGRLLLHRVVSSDEAGPLLCDDAGRLAPHRVAWAAVRGRVITGNPLKKGRTGLFYRLVKRAAGAVLK